MKGVAFNQVLQAFEKLQKKGWMKIHYNSTLYKIIADDDSQLLKMQEVRSSGKSQEMIHSVPLFYLANLVKTMATNNFGDARVCSLINEALCTKNLREGSNIIQVGVFLSSLTHLDRISQ